MAGGQELNDERRASGGVMGDLHWLRSTELERRSREGTRWRGDMWVRGRAGLSEPAVEPIDVRISVREWTARRAVRTQRGGAARGHVGTGTWGEAKGSGQKKGGRSRPQ